MKKHEEEMKQFYKLLTNNFNAFEESKYRRVIKALIPISKFKKIKRSRGIYLYRGEDFSPSR
jgi:hypothetical protein